MISTLLALALVTGQIAPARHDDPLEDKVKEDRVQRLGKGIRCPVCQGVSISDSPSSMAKAQLEKVRELVAAGKTDEQIFDYFEGIYGEWAFLEPRKTGLNAILWFAPLLLVGVGILIIVLQSKGRAPPKAPAPAAPEGEDPYLAAVRADLDK
jgi:cytochrome c-type biogenesis protein CcmH